VWVVLLALGIALPAAGQATQPAGEAEVAATQPPPEAVAWEPWPDLPTPAAAGAAGVMHVSGVNWLIVSGGFGQGNVVSDRAYLMHVTDDGQRRWISERMREARFGHAMVLVADLVPLLIGGERLEGLRKRPVRSLETLRLEPAVHEPLPVDGRGEVVAMPEAEAHGLGQQRVVVQGGRWVAILDALSGQWRQSVRLVHEHYAAATAMVGNTLVVIGGTRTNVIETVDLDTELPGAVAGAVPATLPGALPGAPRVLRCRLPYPLDDAQAVTLPDGRIWLLGGQRGDTGDTVSRTWLLDIERQTLTDGPRLPHVDGVADHCVVAVGRRRWVLVGGESQVDGRDTELTDAVLLRWEPVVDRDAPPSRELNLLEHGAVWIEPLPPTAVAHDDAAAVAVGDTVVVIGGQLPMRVPLTDRVVPMPIATVEALTLPAAD
jgi:hypothetical protein